MFFSQTHLVRVILKLRMFVTDGDFKAFGGTHLPDLTVITPVFDAKGETIIFWAASRGHHADVSRTSRGK